MDIKEALKEKILLLDGAMGTYYESKYPDETAAGAEKALLVCPERITQIHKEYLEAGADVIRTDTFSLPEHISPEEFTALAVSAAGKATEEALKKDPDRTVYIAGVMGPVKYTDEQEEQEVIQYYKDMINGFLKAGIHLFCMETFGEYKMASRIAGFIKEHGEENTVIANFSFNKMGYTHFGYSANRLVRELSGDENIDIFGFNCGVGAAHMSRLVADLEFPKECYFCAMPNAGYQQELTGREMYGKDRHYFSDYMRTILKSGVNLIGSCCGTTPEYTAQLRKLLKEHPTPEKKRFKAADSGQKAAERKNPWMEKLRRGEKVFAVELDSPYGSDAERFIEGAYLLKEEHVDMITISDSPMAKSRAEAVAMAIYVQHRTGMQVLPHIGCRDRNLVALHSAFLGAHINEIRNLLIITGDPVAREDRDKVTPVFDFNSIKLMEYLKHMNEEVFSGDPMYYGGALNYASGKPELIAARMEKKMAAGCSYFLTQPVYSDEDLERIGKLKELTGAKILCGLMPLVSYKNAKFMQNEMPGIHVPQEITDRYRPDMTRDEAEKTAVEVCTQIGQKAAEFTDGYYIMTPFHRVPMVNKIIKNLRKDR